MIIGASDDGLALIDRARRLAPGRPHYAIWQAQFLVTRGEFESARTLLAPVVDSWFPKDAREYARRVMDQAVAADRARTTNTAAATRPAGGSKRGPSPSAGPVVRIFRDVQPGEQRTEATLERIECPRDAVILHVRVGNRAARYMADRLDDVEFLSHRDDLTGPIQCGARSSADRIYLTWRPSAAGAPFDGTAVAVEFLPRERK